MKEFPMCPECEAEYYNPESRRYDAQPVCCNACGPEVYLIKTSDRTIDRKGSDAITEARRVISEGGIVAVKESEDFIFAAMHQMRQQWNC